MTQYRASQTAILVCQGRAVAQDRIAPGRFADPVAIQLLREDERAAVERARIGPPPSGWADRMEYEMLRANGEVMAARTVAIDDAVRAQPHPQLVILGAGLDTRAWRMAELADVDVYEVDQPASQHDKQDRSRDLRPVARSLRFVPVDFSRDALGPELAAAGHQDSVPTTWIWEGVVPYLRRPDIETTLDVIAGRSAPGSRLIVNYQARSLGAWLGRRVAKAMMRLAHRRDPLAREPRRSSWTPASMRALLSAHGLRPVSDEDLLTVAGRLSVPVQRRHQQSLRDGRVAVAVIPPR